MTTLDEIYKYLEQNNMANVAEVLRNERSINLLSLERSSTISENQIADMVAVAIREKKPKQNNALKEINAKNEEIKSIPLVRVMIKLESKGNKRNFC